MEKRKNRSARTGPAYEYKPILYWPRWTVTTAWSRLRNSVDCWPSISGFNTRNGIWWHGTPTTAGQPVTFTVSWRLLSWHHRSGVVGDFVPGNANGALVRSRLKLLSSRQDSCMLCRTDLSKLAISDTDQVLSNEIPSKLPEVDADGTIDELWTGLTVSIGSSSFEQLG